MFKAIGGYLIAGAVVVGAVLAAIALIGWGNDNDVWGLKWLYTIL